MYLLCQLQGVVLLIYTIYQLVIIFQIWYLMLTFVYMCVLLHSLQGTQFNLFLSICLVFIQVHISLSPHTILDTFLTSFQGLGRMLLLIHIGTVAQVPTSLLYIMSLGCSCWSIQHHLLFLILFFSHAQPQVGVCFVHFYLQLNTNKNFGISVCS